MTPKDYLRLWFDTDVLESYIKERFFRKVELDDPIDWINGATIGMAFVYRDLLPDNESEAQFRIHLAMFLGELVRRIEFNEDG